jgi:predicted lipoprotein
MKTKNLIKRLAELCICTQETDVEAGYADYEDTVQTMEELAAAATCGMLNREAKVWEVSNWPGTLKMRAHVRVGNHNMARNRYDAWFTGPDGQQWHGVTIGDNTQLCHCKRLAA